MSFLHIGPAGSYYHSIEHAGHEYSSEYCSGFPWNTRCTSAIFPMVYTSKYTEERGADGKPIARQNLTPEELKQFQGYIFSCGRAAL